MTNSEMSESITRTEFEIATLQAQIDQLQERHDLLKATEAMCGSVLWQLERAIALLNQVSPNQVAVFKSEIEAKFAASENTTRDSVEVSAESLRQPMTIALAFGEWGEELVNPVPNVSPKANSKPDKALAAIFGERTKQYQQFLIIREELRAIGIKVGKLIKSRDDAKGWQLDWSGDKAGLYWTVSNGWDVEALKSGDELTGSWEGFDLIEHLDGNGIDLDPDEELAS